MPICSVNNKFLDSQGRRGPRARKTDDQMLVHIQCKRLIYQSVQPQVWYRART